MAGTVKREGWGGGGFRPPAFLKKVCRVKDLACPIPAPLAEPYAIVLTRTPPTLNLKIFCVGPVS